MRKNGNKIIPFNNIIHFSRVEVLHSTDIFGFLNVDEKEKSCKILLCSSMQFCQALDIRG